MSDTTEPPDVTQGACRGGPTRLVCHADGEMLEECERCEMLVALAEADDWVFGFRARCEGKKG